MFTSGTGTDFDELSNEVSDELPLGNETSEVDGGTGG
jgi:hypothetical protein